MKGKYLLIGLLVMVLLIGGVMSVSAQELYPVPPAATNVKYGGNFRVAVGTSMPLTADYNPFMPDTDVRIVSVVYEPLFIVNLLNGDIVPMLGTSYKWEDNNLKLIITTRQNVKWSDGVPFTAKDVAFTFNYLKKYPAIDTNGIWLPSNDLQTVEASGDNTVIFTFSRPNTSFFPTIAGQLIVPQHIWSSVKDPSATINLNPVGTGPFEVKSIDIPNNTLVFVKNPNYWMKGRPYIDEITYKSGYTNTTVYEWLLSGEIDCASAGLSNIEKMWVDKNPSTNKYWFPVVTTNDLYLNTLKFPFDNPTFRKAISIAIHKSILYQETYGIEGEPANPLAIIPSQLNEWLDPTLKELLNSFAYDPTEAQKLLESVGFTKNSSGQLCYQGKPLPTFTILVPGGGTDSITMADIISNELKSVGISTLVRPEAGGDFISSIMLGEYDMALCWGTGAGPTPYYFYYSEFNPEFSAPIGQKALSDYSHYTNPLITAALNVYSQTSNPNLQKQSMYTIERIMLMDVPLIPLTSRTWFYEWSESKFTGYPLGSPTNPYSWGPGNIEEFVYLFVHLK